MTTASEIRVWFKKGVEQGATHMIVVCDTYDHEDYPVYVAEEAFYEVYDQYNGVNMQRIMEVYDLSKPWPGDFVGRVFDMPERM